MPARTQNSSQHVLTKPIPCHRGHKMHLNMYCPNPYHAREDSKCISTCVYQNPTIPARAQNASPFVKIRTLLYRGGQKMCPSNGSKDPKCISNLVKHLCYGMPEKTQNVSQPVCKNPSLSSEDRNVSQNVFTKTIPYQRSHKKYL